MRGVEIMSNNYFISEKLTDDDGYYFDDSEELDDFDYEAEYNDD